MSTIKFESVPPSSIECKLAQYFQDRITAQEDRSRAEESQVAIERWRNDPQIGVIICGIQDGIGFNEAIDLLINRTRKVVPC